MPASLIQPAPSTRLFGIIALCLLFAGIAANASPCTSLKARPDAWVAASVDALVQAARDAYVSDEAIPAYERILDGIAASIRQCNLSQDKNFISRYKTFAEYIEAASLDRQPDHELGFLVADKQYFEETRQFVEIPGPGFCSKACTGGASAPKVFFANST